MSEASPQQHAQGAPGDTRPVTVGDPPSVADSEQAIKEATKGGTNLDTLVGRMVVEQGLATEEEVQHALQSSKDGSGGVGQQSLAHILVDRQFVTKRQIARLRQMIEAERSGQQIPGYKILSKLGAGAMATVYKSRQISLDRLVAIKVLPQKFTSNPQFVERFYAEGRAAAQLNHPNIVQAFDVGKANEYHYFVMEYVEGTSVYDDIMHKKRYKEAEAIEIAMQMAEALHHAHERGLIHRDVKPKNIMLTKDGVAKLADMGLARAVSDKDAAEAEAGKAFGTPYYISPEQIRGETTVGPPADIYSLGATLYHMVTGSVPFEGKNPSAVMHKHLKADLVPPDHVNPKLSAGISEIIEMMMAKSVRKRYATCADLLLDLKDVRAGNKPAIAHKGVVSAAAFEDIVAAEAQAHAELAEAKPKSGGSPFTHPLFIAVVAVAALSLAANLVLLLVR